MLDKLPKPKLLSGLSLKSVPWILAGGAMTTAATILGATLLLNAIGEAPIPVSQEIGAGSSASESLDPDLALETAVMETVVSLQNSEAVSPPVKTVEATVAAALETSPTPTDILWTATSIPLEPTSTPPPTSTEPATICGSYSLSDFLLNRDQVSWQLDAGGAEATLLKRVSLSWPADNGSLFKVDLSGATIWVGEVESPTTIHSWTGGETSRIVEGRKRLTFRFKDDARAHGYTLDVGLANGCQLSISN
jgi:hypothetical protein